MLMLEYQGKRLLAGVGVPVPQGIVIEASAAPDPSGARISSFPVAVKAQVRSGGRGKHAGSGSSTDQERMGSYTETADSAGGRTCFRYAVPQGGVDRCRPTGRCPVTTA